MKFKIGEKVYNARALDDLTLGMILQLEQETIEFGRPLRLAEIKVMADELDKLKTNDERGMHPHTPWVLAVTIWASRRLAGEKVDFGEAIDFPMSDLTFLAEPQDHKNPTKARPPTRKGSGRAAGPRATSARKTSGSPSTR